MNDDKLTTALDAFCKRLIEGSPLFAAIKACEETE